MQPAVAPSKPEITTTCPECEVRYQRFGIHRNGLRRFRRPTCKKAYTEPHKLTLGKMYCSEGKVLMALELLIEGNSSRSHHADYRDGSEYNR